MIRTTIATDKMCKMCAVKPVEIYGRCRTCYLSYKCAQKLAYYEKRKRDLDEQNEALALEGMCICRNCFRKLPLADYRPSKARLDGRRNKLCSRCIARSKGYKHKEPDGIQWYRRAYVILAYERKRIARMRGISLREVPSNAHLASELAGALEEKYAASTLCAYCRTELTALNIAVDHETAASAGGSSSADNLALCCSDCNHLKNTRSRTEFFEFLRDYSSRLVKVVEAQDKEPAR